MVSLYWFEAMMYDIRIPTGSSKILATIWASSPPYLVSDHPPPTPPTILSLPCQGVYKSDGSPIHWLTLQPRKAAIFFALLWGISVPDNNSKRTHVLDRVGVNLISNNDGCTLAVDNANQSLINYAWSPALGSTDRWELAVSFRKILTSCQRVDVFHQKFIQIEFDKELCWWCHGYVFLIYTISKLCLSVCGMPIVWLI